MSTRTKLIGLAFLVLIGVFFLLPSGMLFKSPAPWKVETVWSARLSDAIAVDRVRASREGGGFEITVFRFARDRVRASIADLVGTTLDERRKLDQATLAVNGGYVDRDFKPVGLVRIDGVETGGVSAIPVLSGWVLIDAEGRLRLAASDDGDAVAKARSAFQAGPFVVDPGGTNGISRSSTKGSERTVLATATAASGDTVLVLVTTPVSLYDLADVLVTQPKALGVEKIDAALNLDGGPSSGFAVDDTDALKSNPPREKIRVGLFLK